MTDPVIRKAVELRSALLQTAKEIQCRIRPDSSEATRSLLALDVAVCLDASDMLKKLGTEVIRLREAIGCHHYGWDSQSPTIDRMENQLRSLAKMKRS
jgi:hypothetical protein